jgi:hypothetical protein
MSAASTSSPPPSRRPPLLAPRSEERGSDVGLASKLALELQRLGLHPLREVRRLEHEARAGESPATPLVLIVFMAATLWSIVLLVVGVAVLAAALLA